MDEPEWSDFRIVCALAEAGSVAGAARDLGVDTSTVSRRLAALEEALGADLFVRTARGVSLTAEGRTVQAAAQTMAETVTSCKNAVRASKTGIDGKVSLTCVSTMVPVLASWLSSLKASFPDLRVEIQSDDSIVDLSKGKVDIAIRMIRPREPDLIVRKAVEMGWGFYATPNYVAGHGLVRSLAELQSRIIVPYSEKLRGPAFVWLDEEVGGARAAAQAGSPEAALNIAVSVNAIAFVPCYGTDEMANFVRVYPEPVFFHDIYVTYHETLKDTARIHVVAEALIAFLRGRRDIFGGRAIA